MLDYLPLFSTFLTFVNLPRKKKIYFFHLLVDYFIYSVLKLDFILLCKKQLYLNLNEKAHNICLFVSTLPKPSTLKVVLIKVWAKGFDRQSLIHTWRKNRIECKCIKLESLFWQLENYKIRIQTMKMFWKFQQSKCQVAHEYGMDLDIIWCWL